MKLIKMNKLKVKKHYLVIKKANFDCPPFGQIFEKQTKGIQNQGDKKVEEYKETNELTKKYDYHAGKDSPSNLRQKEIFNKIVDERREKIAFSNLTY